jgi:hypothetical protein
VLSKLSGVKRPQKAAAYRLRSPGTLRFLPEGFSASEPQSETNLVA